MANNTIFQKRRESSERSAGNYIKNMVCRKFWEVEPDVVIMELL